MGTSTSHPNSFSLLNDLPLVLWERIWDHAVDPFRVLRITLYQRDWPPGGTYLGSDFYGPPWHVKAGSTRSLREATRNVRNLLLVSRKVYLDIKQRILPDTLYVTVAQHVSRWWLCHTETRYSIPWNRKTERICLEMVHLNWENQPNVRLVDNGIREEIQRAGDGLPPPPVWINGKDYEPFGQNGVDDDDAESDADESRNPARPSKYYQPPRSLLSQAPDPPPAFRYNPDPNAPGQLYIPSSVAQTLCSRHVSLAPTATTPGGPDGPGAQLGLTQVRVTYHSPIPLLLLAKIFRVTNIIIIADSILNANRDRSIWNNIWEYNPMSTSRSRGLTCTPDSLDSHKTLDSNLTSELATLHSSLRALLASGWQRHTRPDLPEPPIEMLSREEVLAREIKLMNLGVGDLRKIRVWRVAGVEGGGGAGGDTTGGGGF